MEKGVGIRKGGNGRKRGEVWRDRVLECRSAEAGRLMSLVGVRENGGEAKKEGDQ